MVDGNASNSTTHEQVQAVTTLRSGRVIDNKVGKEGKGKDVSLQNPNLTPHSPTEKKETTLETSSEPRAPFPERLKEPPCAGK
jgi:hypothetical protein